MFGLFISLLCKDALKTPLDFAKQQISSALGSRASDVKIQVKKNGQPEIYTISTKDGKATITGTDEVGAMYGATEFAETAKYQPDKAWTLNKSSKPYLKDRGLNLFLTLPWNYAKNDTDYDIAALTDPNRWWFHNEDYWTTLLDLMAESRLNWLDIHGAWDISVTNAPNLYAYFVTSKSFPKVGVSEQIKAQNLKQLNHVIDMAHARGIRVSLMAYEANLRIPQNPNPGYEASEANIYQYTKEVVEQMIRRAPGLDAIGYRIGESGKSESFFKCYDEALKAAGREIPLITRSWITRRQRVLPLARASKDFTVEIKYNGEQWGPPYMVAGGRMASWYSYSFEDYLSDAGETEKNAKTWPGNENWPGNPYKIVWQVRANGTHRIFPFYNPDLVRASIEQMKIGTASGYTIEGLDAYYPKSPDYYLADIKDKYCDWIHQRDEMYWRTWGRLGYDPSTPDEVFDARVKQDYKSDSLPDVWKRASEIIPRAFSAFSLGPDHRNHAPELESGGDTYSLVQNEPFDTAIYRPFRDEAAYKILGITDGRIPITEAIAGLRRSISLDRSFSDKRLKELGTAIDMLNNLGKYYSDRLNGAATMAMTEAPTRTINGSPFRASSALSVLANSPYYKPFTERLRMRTNTFDWKSQLIQILADEKNMAALPQAEFMSNLQSPKAPSFSGSGQRLSDNRIKFTLEADCTKAWLVYKPLPSSTFFHRTSMVKKDKGFEVVIPDEPSGFCFTYDIEQNGRVIRTQPFGEFRAPYRIIPAQKGPTPQIYSTEEALNYLNPDSLDPKKYEMMLVAPRAGRFFNGFSNAAKRKLLTAVEKGMKLVILQQDYTSGRYKLDWLPKPIKVENNPQPDVFDGGGLLGIGEMNVSGVLWQRFLPSDGWEVPGNGGMARMKYGKGIIILSLGRFLQRSTNTQCALALKRIMDFNGVARPMVIVDPGTEDAVFSTSFFPDLANAMGIPFLTLGEVIAKEQGMNEYKVIEGPVNNNDILQGRGEQIANTFLRGEVVKASKRTPPANRTEFERERSRRKFELIRSLGLDGLKKTPLNVKETGVIPRKGYKIEKIVFESRPKFYVTAHVYKPDNAIGRLPVIMNVNGHWAHKKNEDRIQLRCAFQALQGYIAIAIDSPGWSFEGNSLIERRVEGSHNDFALVQGGTNTTGFYVWDAIRALDYMATRDDTDMSKIGITGASGGGLATLYTFAADDRYSAAVPVVYLSSMELAPDNGCLCNHVPGTCQVGDRSDVIGIQAPKPVFIMGAQNDGEFPPAATVLTHKKMEVEWALFGKKDAVHVKIFDGPHDYNQLMREQMIGFFNKALKGVGDGSPVPQPPLEAINPEDPILLAANPYDSNERTMRDLAIEHLREAKAAPTREQAIALNGGVPPVCPLNVKVFAGGGMTFEPIAGLTTPAILVKPSGAVKSVEIVATDQGKAVAASYPMQKDRAYLFVDILGTGELQKLELRYPVYLGRSVAFYGGVQLARAKQIVAKLSKSISVIGDGPISSQAAMWAGIIDENWTSVTSKNGLSSWDDVFSRPGLDLAIQPRANLFGKIEELAKLVKVK